MKTDVVLLPGLHGSTALFNSFIALAPPWAACHALALPDDGSQSFDALATRLEPALRALQNFVLFAESFAAPVAVRLTERLGDKAALLVLCNPLVESPLSIAPPFAAALLQSRLVPERLTAHAMTGGDRSVARTMMREVKRLPRRTLAERLAIACDAGRDDIVGHVSAPLLAVVGSKDRLVSPRVIHNVLKDIPFAVEKIIDAPHLAAQVEPAAVWAAIDGFKE